MNSLTRAVADVHARLAHARADLLARDEQTVARQIALTAIAAPTGGEQARAAWIAAQFRAFALDSVRTDSAGNVIGTRNGTTPSPPVVMMAHLDTVFPSDAINEARRSGDRVSAPGIGDNGRGLAAMLAIAGVMHDRAIHTPRTIHFVATTGEEGAGDLHGAKHYFAEHPVAHAAIALDGTGDDRIVHKAVGSRRIRVTLDGPGGHSWADFGAANPVHACATIVARLSALPLGADPRVSLTVARIGGGMAVNAIPQRAWFEVDIRSTSPAPVRVLEQKLRALIDSEIAAANARRADGTASMRATVDVFGDRPCGELAGDAPLVQIAMAATDLVGVSAALATASTDANVPLSLGIPAITIGGGGTGGDVHTLGEWYDNRDGVRGIARALTVIVAAATI